MHPKPWINITDSSFNSVLNTLQNQAYIGELSAKTAYPNELNLAMRRVELFDLVFVHQSHEMNFAPIHRSQVHQLPQQIEEFLHFQSYNYPIFSFNAALATILIKLPDLKVM